MDGGVAEVGGRLSMLGLFVSALIVGLLAGAAGAAFQYAVRAVAGIWSAWISLAQGMPVLRWAVPMATSAVLVWVAYALVRHLAPEAAGSGVQEIEGALEDERPTRWWRVLPVKFVAGALALGAGMVAGREGPTIQMGGNLGRMIADVTRMRQENMHTLIAAGAAGGLSAAFNAPLAGIVFVVEEMRAHFRYNFASVTGVMIASVASAMVLRFIMGQQPDMPMATWRPPPLGSLWMFLIVGAVFGVLGAGFNRAIVGSLDLFGRLRGKACAWSGIWVGAVMGLLAWGWPDVAGGGYEMMPRAMAGAIPTGLLLVVFGVRLGTTLFSYGSGVPGGIFAPMLALGTALGMAMGYGAHEFFPQWVAHPAIFAVVGMGALFAATVRAPLTGIVLVIEMTSNYTLILPLILTCLTATIVAHTLGGRPICTVLLERTLAKCDAGA